MTSFLYFVLCGGLAALATLELCTGNRTARIQTYLTLLGAVAFCGVFALLVAAGEVAGGAYRGVASAGVVLLTGASLFLLLRVSRRFRSLRTQRPNA